MALTIVVRGPPAREGDSPGPGSGASQAVRGQFSRDLSITLDAPRIVLGRGESCDVLLPDPSVSHRHASIRQRGGEYLLVDEQSHNGTFIGRVKLAPQSPRALKEGQKIRLGRVWLEVRIDAAAPPSKMQGAAKDLALSLIIQGLAAEGEDARPQLLVRAGPDAGKRWVLEEAGRRYVLGRARDADFVLDDPNASRRHLSVMRKGDQVTVQDLSAKVPVMLGEKALGAGESVWKPGQELTVADDHIVFEYAAKEALAEILRCPDESVRPDESFELPEPEGDAPSAGDDREEDAAKPVLQSNAAQKARKRATPAAESGFGMTDGAIFLLALGVLALSIAGMWLLLGPK